MKYILFLFLICVSTLAAGELKVVSISPALTELICFLGKEKLLVGRSEVCNYPESVKKLPVAGRLAIPFVEKTVGLKPDLLVANDLVNPGVKAALERSGIKTLVMPCRSMADYKKCVEVLGKELNASEAAARELERIARWENKPRKKLDLKILWVVWDTPLLTPGRRALLHDIIVKTGADNATGEFDQEYMRPSFDKLLKKDIDVIIWSASSAGWKQRRVWQKFSAVQKKWVLEDLHQDSLLRPGPRLPEAVDNLMKQLEKWSAK